MHPEVAQIVLRRDKEDKADKGDKGDSTETKKDFCKNGMLPGSIAVAIKVRIDLMAETTKYQ